MRFLKNIILAIAFIGVMFSCNPLDDAYEELDVLEAEAGEDADVTILYTLEELDYGVIAGYLEENETVEDSAKADFIVQYNAFNSSMETTDLLKEFVNDEYPQLRKGAAVQVTYSILEGDDFEDASAEYVSSTGYSLEADDYAMVSVDAGNAGFFDTENQEAGEDQIGDILGSAFQSPLEGDIVTVTYEVVDVPYASLPSGTVVFTEAFETSLGDFTAIDIAGDQSFEQDESFGSTYAIMSGFSGGALENEDWLISPEIDLSGSTGDITLKMSQILNFQGDAVWGTDLRIVYATDYTGDVATATWQDLTFDVLPAGNNWDVFDNTAKMNGAAGQTIHLGFYYRSTTDDAPNWRLTNIVLEEGVTPDTDDVDVLYQYNGSSWENAEENAYFLRIADYDAMGTGSGQPGRFNNFSDDTAPENYLPAFLGMRFPFAQEGDEYVVLYKYFSGSTGTRGGVYIYTSGVWTPAVNEDQIVEKTDQFKHTGDEFLFNPSVTLTMVSSDYQYVVDEVAKTNPDLVNSFGTGEDLYGADAFFVNFDTRLSSRLENDDNGDPLQPEYVGLSEDDSEALIAERVTEGIDVFLEARFAAVEPIEGIDILYTITYDTYDGTDGEGTEVFILTDIGTFEPYTAE